MRRLITPLAVGALAASFAVLAAATPRAYADCGTIPIETDGDGFGLYDDRQLPPGNEEWLPPDNDGWLPPNNDGWLPPDNEGRLPPDNDGWLPPDNDGWLPPDNEGWLPPGGEGSLPPGDEGWEDARDSRGHPILKVKVQEPTQNAVIGWNGVEQIMVLKTQLRATHKVKMMEIMPVPARPTVTEGDPQLFDKAMRLFESKHGLRPIVMAPKAGGPGATIIEEVQIGNHHIAVAQVVDPSRFVAWANNYVKSRVGDKARPAFSEMGKRIVAQYLSERYTYWIFDLIDLDTQMREHVAIQYRFPTTYLYYPMRITRTSGTGNTHVQLLVFTRELLGFFRGLDQSLIETPRPSVDVLPQELRNLNAELADLFGSNPVRLRLWELKGPIQSFQGDLQAKARLGSDRFPVRPPGGDRSRPPESSAVRPSARTEDSAARSQMDRPGSTKEPDRISKR